MSMTNVIQEIEQWKDIPGYEGLYQISTFGRVRSMTRTQMTSTGFTQTIQERIMKSGLNKDGYRQAILSRSGIATTYRICRIVAKVFITEINGKTVVNHINGDRGNDNMNNLEWCTQSYNVKDGYNRGRKPMGGRRKKELI